LTRKSSCDIFGRLERKARFGRSLAELTARRIK
jgi:hypothetical protein